MYRHSVFTLIAAGFLSSSMLLTLPVYAEEVPAATEELRQMQEANPEAQEESEVEKVELPLTESKIETHSQVRTFAGYRFFSFDGNVGRAAEYEDLHSGPTFGLTNSILGRDHKFIVDGSYLSDNDYFGDLSYDYMGAYRVHLRSESLYHNLDRLPSSVPNAFTFGSPYQGDTTNDAARYGMRAEQDLASLRARMGYYPIHLNLQYWRMIKEGATQLRYADQAFFPSTATNTIYSANRLVNRETHEGKLGFDAHLGPIDLIYDFTVRQYTDHAGIPSDNYVARVDALHPEYLQRAGGTFDHNETPDSRYMAHSVKLHTEQTGGIVIASAYTFAQRSNLSSLTQVSGANGLTDTLHTAAGDLVYTPCKEFSLAVRFRHQEIDRETATVSMSLFTPSTMYAYQGIDTKRDIISTIMSFRPVNDYTVKAEYRGDFLRRSNVTAWDPYINNVAGMSLPENEEIHRGIIAFMARPLKGLRLKARYSYTANGQPAYGVSYDERHEGQLLATYTMKDRWGISANYLNSREHNGSKSISTLRAFADPVTNPLTNYALPRDKTMVSASASIWANFFAGRLNVTGTAGLLKSSIDQDILYAATTSGSSAAANYTSNAILYGITTNLRPIEKLDLSLAFQQVISDAEFDPSYLQYATSDTTGVKELTWLKTVENSVSFKAAYDLTKNVSCGVDYRYRQYSDDRDALYDGAVHAIIASMSAKW